MPEHLSIKLLLWVGVGGALGAMARYGVTVTFMQWFPIPLIPYATLMVNVTGGILAGAAISGFGLTIGNPSHALLISGFCGGLTTFSTFSLEMYQMLLREAYLTALGYTLVSVILAVAGVIVGMRLAAGYLSS